MHWYECWLPLDLTKEEDGGEEEEGDDVESRLETLSLIFCLDQRNFQEAVC